MNVEEIKPFILKLRTGCAMYYIGKPELVARGYARSLQDQTSVGVTGRE